MLHCGTKKGTSNKLFLLLCETIISMSSRQSNDEKSQRLLTSLSHANLLIGLSTRFTSPLSKHTGRPALASAAATKPPDLNWSASHALSGKTPCKFKLDLYNFAMRLVCCGSREHSAVFGKQKNDEKVHPEKSSPKQTLL